MKLFSKWLETANQLPSVRVIKALLPRMAQAAQEVYDAWSQDEDGNDEELGGGGICQDIADAMAGVVGEAGVEVKTMDSNGVGEQHVWFSARFAEGIYDIDISPSVYETGGGYNWKKIPDVTFTPQHVAVYKSELSDEDFDDDSW